MTMLDRYLDAVRGNLPKDQAAGDIVAEIGDDLQSQMEERESTLGRPLTEDERAELIKAYGFPSVVAARYGRVRYLIGPELLPYYWSTLRLVASVAIAIELICGGVLAVVSGNGELFFRALGAAWDSLIWIFAIVTVVFAATERVPRRDGRHIGTVLFKWDPRRLPEPGALPPAPRFSTIAEFIANFIALLVLLDAGGPHHIPLDAVISNALHLMRATLTPAWHAVYAGAVVATGLVAVSAIVTFVRPQLRAVHEAVRAIASASIFAGAALTMLSGPLVQPADGPLAVLARYALIAVMAVAGLQLTIVALRTASRTRKRAEA